MYIEHFVDAIPSEIYYLGYLLTIWRIENKLRPTSLLHKLKKKVYMIRGNW